MEEQVISPAKTTREGFSVPRYNLENLGEKNQHIQDILNRHPIAKDLLRQLAEYHSGTFDHSIDVGRGVYAFTTQITSRDTLSPDDIEAVTLAGLLHDIGKMKLGEEGKEILSSPRPLTDDERTKVEQHARLGFVMVKEAAERVVPRDNLLSEAANIMIAHHEFQPNPYPRDLQKDDARREPNPKRQLLQRYVAAFDQAVGLAQGGEGGHAYMGNNLSAREVRQRLMVDRNNNPTAHFADISPRVVYTLVKIGVIQNVPNQVRHG